MQQDDRLERIKKDLLTTVYRQLGLDDVMWLVELNQFKLKGRKAIGTIEKLKQYVNNTNKFKLVRLNEVVQKYWLGCMNLS